MAGIENGGEAHARLQGLDQDSVHFVVDDVAIGAEVYGVDDFVVAVVFVAVEVFGLATVACGEKMRGQRMFVCVRAMQR